MPTTPIRIARVFTPSRWSDRLRERPSPDGNRSNDFKARRRQVSVGLVKSPNAPTGVVSRQSPRLGFVPMVWLRRTSSAHVVHREFRARSRRPGKRPDRVVSAVRFVVDVEVDHQVMGKILEHHPDLIGFQARRRLQDCPGLEKLALHRRGDDCCLQLFDAHLA